MALAACEKSRAPEAKLTDDEFIMTMRFRRLIEPSYEKAHVRLALDDQGVLRSASEAITLEELASHIQSIRPNVPRFELAGLHLARVHVALAVAPQAPWRHVEWVLTVLSEANVPWVRLTVGSRCMGLRLPPNASLDRSGKVSLPCKRVFLRLAPPLGVEAACDAWRERAAVLRGPVFADIDIDSATSAGDVARFLETTRSGESLWWRNHNIEIPLGEERTTRSFPSPD